MFSDIPNTAISGGAGATNGNAGTGNLGNYLGLLDKYLECKRGLIGDYE